MATVNRKQFSEGVICAAVFVEELKPVTVKVDLSNGACTYQQSVLKTFGASTNLPVSFWVSLYGIHRQTSVATSNGHRPEVFSMFCERKNTSKWFSSYLCFAKYAGDDEVSNLLS
jgi:hypothetical protein